LAQFATIATLAEVESFEKERSGMQPLIRAESFEQPSGDGYRF
jgi:hypothetical protein